MSRKENAIRQFVAVGFALLAFLFIGRCVVGCVPMTAAQKREAAAVSYEAEQMQCVDQYADTAHIDVCRDKVKARWAKDGGHD